MDLNQVIGQLATPDMGRWQQRHKANPAPKPERGFGLPEVIAALYGANKKVSDFSSDYLKENALFGAFSDSKPQQPTQADMEEEITMRALDAITPFPMMGMTKGVQKLSTKGLGVDMGHLQIADKNLKAGKRSVTPNDPIEVTHNLDTGEYNITDGYHRYLESRGGSIDEALKRSKAGDFNDINATVKEVRTRKTDDGFNVEEVVDSRNALGGGEAKRVKTPKKIAASKWKGKTEEDFIGKPRITKEANAKDLYPSELRYFDKLKSKPFLGGKYRIKMNKDGASVYDGDTTIASYNFGDTLSVDKKYRRQGVGEELVYQFRTKYPDVKPATHRTKKSQKLQKKVWDRIEEENRLADYDEYIAKLRSEAGLP